MAVHLVHIGLKITADPNPTAVDNTTALTFTTIDPERDGALKSIRVYINNKLVTTLTSRPFVYNYKPDVIGEVTISALAIDTLKHESNLKSQTIYVNKARSAYKNVDIPGTFQAEDFDRCMEGISFHCKLYYIGCGKDDFLYRSVLAYNRQLDEIGFDYFYRETGGGHTWGPWRIYLSEMAQMIFK